MHRTRSLGTIDGTSANLTRFTPHHHHARIHRFVSLTKNQMIAAVVSAMAFAPTMPMVTRPSAMASSPSIMMATDWKKPAMSVFLALALTFSPMDAAEAGRSGGRVGGRAPSMSSRPASRPSSGASARPAMRTSAPAPAPMRRTTNVYMGSPMGGSMYGGGMYGGGMYGGGMMGGGNGMGLYLGLSVAGTAGDSNTRRPVAP